MGVTEFNPEDHTIYFNGRAIGVYGSTAPRSNSWYVEYMKEKAPTVREAEPHLGFIRESYYENGRHKVRRVPVVHG